MSDRFKRVTFHSHDVAWIEQGVLDTQENRVAPFGPDNGDLLEDVLSDLNYDADWTRVYWWTDADKVRIN